MTHPGLRATLPPMGRNSGRQPQPTPQVQAYDAVEFTPPTPGIDAAQQFVDLTVECERLRTENAKLRAAVERTWRSHLVEAADGTRHTVRADSVANALEAVGDGAKFRGYLN